MISIDKGVVKKFKVKRTRKGITDHKLFEIDVKRYWRPKTKVTFAEDGDQSIEGVAGDVIFELDVKPHPFFTIAQEHLIYRKRISLKEALLGLQFSLATIDKQVLEIDYRGQVLGIGHLQKVVANKGMPKKDGGYGHLKIEFVVSWPEALIAEDRALIAQCAM
jgi:DnaJ family protein B protein 4